MLKAQGMGEQQPDGEMVVLFPGLACHVRALWSPWPDGIGGLSVGSMG